MLLSVPALSSSEAVAGDAKRRPRRSVSYSHGIEEAAHVASDRASFIFRTPDLREARQASQNHWTKPAEEYARWVALRAGGFQWMHAQCAVVYHRWYNIVGVGAIVTNTIAVALNVPYIVACQDAFNPMKITAIIIGGIVTVVMAFQQFKDFGGLRRDHGFASANYAALYDTIRNELQKEAKDREDANTYLGWITKQMTDLKASSPIVTPSVLLKYREMIDGKNIPDPEGIDEIYINRQNGEVIFGSSETGERKPVPRESGRPTGRIFGKRTESGDVGGNSGSSGGDPEIVVERITPTQAELIALERWNEQ